MADFEEDESPPPLPPSQLRIFGSRFQIPISGPRVLIEPLSVMNEIQVENSISCATTAVGIKDRKKRFGNCKVVSIVPMRRRPRGGICFPDPPFQQPP